MKTHGRSLDADDIERAKQKFEDLKISVFPAFLAEPQTEADTRSKLIDAILREVLGWPETLIVREPYVEESGGYVDYVLSTSHPYFVVEAKKHDRRYKLPISKTRRQYKIGGVLKEDAALYGDLAQARRYAIDKGVGFCCLTNGIQFVFFRSQNDSGVPWDKHIALVFRDHDDIASNFSLFFHVFSHYAVAQGIVHGHLPITENYDEALRRFQKLDPQKQVLHRNRERNRLFPALKSVIARVFQDISGDSEASAELLEHCYVESARDSSYEKGLDGLMRRRPVEIGHGAKPLNVGKKDGGAFQKAVDSYLTLSQREPEVLLILGGVGVGKTTFIHRFRKVIARDSIDDECLWAYIDLNRYSDTGESLLDWVVNAAWSSLEDDYGAIGLADYAALKQAYHSEYESLKRGRLAPLYAADPEKFEIAFAEQLQEFEKSRDQHFIRVMRASVRRTGRKPFLVFDNADQFSEDTQDQVFRLAQRFAKEIGCASVISLREESYWKNKDHGTLSAFHAISYLVQPPRLRQVVSKRLKFAQKLLEESKTDFVDSEEKLVTARELADVLHAISQTLLAQDSRYLELLELTSPFEIRRPLQFLSRFLVSGHTNMDALLNGVRQGRVVPIGFHEFVQAIALGDREYYTEAASDIVNLFAVDGRSDASNLNRIVVLGRLLKAKHRATPVGEGFIQVADLISDCESLGMMPDTVRSILALFNAKRLVDTEAQDRQSLGSATFVRASVASQYYLEKLIYDFAYLDSMVVDTAIGDDLIFDRLKRLTDQMWEYRSKKGDARLKRLELRLERAKVFLRHLTSEFERSTAGRSPEALDPLVTRFFTTAEGRFTKQSHEVMDNARAIFS